MKTYKEIREDLKNIRYYFSRKDAMSERAVILGECNILKTIAMYNEVVCQAPPKLYDLYYFIYVENNTHESAADKIGVGREYITRLHAKLLRFIQNHLVA